MLSVTEFVKKEKTFFLNHTRALVTTADLVINSGICSFKGTLYVQITPQNTLQSTLSLPQPLNWCRNHPDRHTQKVTGHINDDRSLAICENVYEELVSNQPVHNVLQKLFRSLYSEARKLQNKVSTYHKTTKCFVFAQCIFGMHFLILWPLNKDFFLLYFK